MVGSKVLHKESGRTGTVLEKEIDKIKVQLESYEEENKMLKEGSNEVGSAGLHCFGWLGPISNGFASDLVKEAVPALDLCVISSGKQFQACNIIVGLPGGGQKNREGRKSLQCSRGRI